MASEDQYMWALKKAGMPIKQIAEKMGISITAVKTRIKSVEALAKEDMKLGSIEMVDHFNAMCMRYQMLGEDLKKLGAHLCNPVMPEDIRKAIGATDEETIVNLLTKYIVLHPWKQEDGIPISPEPGNN